MTNKELQQKLATYPDDLVVFREDAEWGPQEIERFNPTGYYLDEAGEATEGRAPDGVLGPPDAKGQRRFNVPCLVIG